MEKTFAFSELQKFVEMPEMKNKEYKAMTEEGGSNKNELAAQNLLFPSYIWLILTRAVREGFNN